MLTFLQIVQLIDEMRAKGASDASIVANLCELREKGILLDEIPPLIAANVDANAYEEGLNLFTEKSYQPYCKNVAQVYEMSK